MLPNAPSSNNNNFSKDCRSKCLSCLCNHFPQRKGEIPMNSNNLPTSCTERTQEEKMTHGFLTCLMTHNIGVIIQDFVLSPEHIYCIQPIKEQQPKEELVFSKYTRLPHPLEDGRDGYETLQCSICLLSSIYRRSPTVCPTICVI